MRTLDVCRMCWGRKLETGSWWKSREGVCEMKEMTCDAVEHSYAIHCHPTTEPSRLPVIRPQIWGGPCGLLPVTGKEVGASLGVAGGQLCWGEKKRVQDFLKM